MDKQLAVGLELFRLLPTVKGMIQVVAPKGDAGDDGGGLEVDLSAMLTDGHPKVHVLVRHLVHRVCVLHTRRERGEGEG